MTAPLTRSGRANTSGTRGGDTGVVPFPLAEEDYSKENEQKFRRQLWDIVRPLNERASALGSTLFALAASDIANDSSVSGANVKLALQALEAVDATKQPLDASLTAYAALTTAANKGIYFTAADTPATYDLTAAGLALLDDANASAQLATLGAAAVDAISVLTTDRLGSDVGTAQNIFASSEDALTLAANTTYKMRASYNIQRSAGTNAHSFGFLLGGTATFTSIGYFINAHWYTGSIGDEADYTSATNPRVWMNSATRVALGGTANAAEQIYAQLDGIIRSNVAGTIIPQFQYSAAPGGVPTFRKNSYFMMVPLGVDTMASAGAWA